MSPAGCAGGYRTAAANEPLVVNRGAEVAANTLSMLRRVSLNLP